MGQHVPGDHPRLVLPSSGKKTYGVESLPPLALRKRLKDQLDLVDGRLASQLVNLTGSRPVSFGTRLSRSAVAPEDWDGLIMLGYLVAQRKAILSALETV